MRAHWKTSHAAEALDEDGSGKGSQRGRNHQSSIAQFVQRAHPPSNCPLWKVNGANDLLVRWCWTNLRPLDIVNDEGLRDFVKFLEPGYHLPSRTFVAKQLALCHQEGLDTLQKVLQAQARAGVSITSDIWTSAATQAFNTTTVHFIDQAWRMKCFVLGTVSFEGHHYGVRIAELLLRTTRSVCLVDRDVVAHVHDEAANAELAGRLLFESSEWISEVCAGHKLQNCIKKAFADNPALDNLVSSCRKLVGHFKHSALATDMLLKKQEQLKKRPLKPVQDVVTRWNSVYLMLDRLLYLKVALSALFEDDDFTKAGTSQSCSHLMLKSRQRDMV